MEIYQDANEMRATYEGMAKRVLENNARWDLHQSELTRIGFKEENRMNYHEFSDYLKAHCPQVDPEDLDVSTLPPGAIGDSAEARFTRKQIADRLNRVRFESISGYTYIQKSEQIIGGYWVYCSTYFTGGAGCFYWLVAATK